MMKRYRGWTCALSMLLFASACQREPEQNGATSLDTPQGSAGPLGAAKQASAPPAEAPAPTSPVAAQPIQARELRGSASIPSTSVGPNFVMPSPAGGGTKDSLLARPTAAKRSAVQALNVANDMDWSGASAPMQLRRSLPVGSSVTAVAPPVEDSAKFNTEAYAATEELPFLAAKESPLSTFSIDVDTASYSNVRRFLTERQLPPNGAIRVEELVNYFPYDYAEPKGDAPFSLNTEVSTAPWDPSHRLLHVGLQAKHIPTAQLPPRNLVFLLDVSGSMNEPNKLPLVKRSLATLTDTLTERDQIAIVVYAGASGLVLAPTAGDKHAEIRAALDRLEAGGSTNGAQGIELAYSEAEHMARPGSMNRVVLATDGDFNVGVTSQSSLFSLISEKRKSHVFLSVLGFGMGNYKDSMLELLADKGNGNYAYIDTLAEARKVLVAQGGATLSILAKDVKLQLEFNPEQVGAYRLIGYENRQLAARDFNDDSKDAGELGAGQSVTALYELVPPGVAVDSGHTDALRYQKPAAPSPGHTGELCTLKARYKAPNSEQSQLIEQVVPDAVQPLAATSTNFRFAAAVAVFGMTLRQSPARGNSSFELAKQLAEGALGRDPEGYRHEFSSLVDTARSLPH